MVRQDLGQDLVKNNDAAVMSAFVVASPTVEPSQGTPGPSVPTVVPPLGELDPSSGGLDTQDGQQLQPHVLQPQPSVDDELSEKLRTIQLSRPKIPLARNLKSKSAAANNHVEGRLNGS
jgi:hypothetical protein